MGFQILKYLVAIFIFSRLTQQQTTPVDRCGSTGTGYVCLDCYRRGKCLLSSSDITVQFDSMCISEPQTYCDDTINDPSMYGTCSPLPAQYTNCSCSSFSECIADINNPSVVLHCESDPPVTDPECSAPALDLTTCGCLTCSDETVCPLVDDPNDDCRSYFLCSGRDLTSYSCRSGLCFDQTSCGCVESGGLTSIAPTPDPNCPLIDDPNDDCQSYFVLNGNILIPLNCSDGLCFNQADCACEERGPTAAPTTATDSPSDCPFVDDPNDCGSYFIFDGTKLIPTSCPGTQCFNQTRCGCFNNGGSSSTTSTTTTSSSTIVTQRTTSSSITCPSGCPFADDPDPNAACGSFYICDDQDVIKAVCPGILCFDQALCQCV